MPLPHRAAPSVARIEQYLPADQIADVRGEIRERSLGADLGERISPGMRVAITAGSRGMDAFVDLLYGTVDAVKSVGGEPFLIPAMGSHGGATAEGQIEILNRLGVTEETVVAPIGHWRNSQAPRIPDFRRIVVLSLTEPSLGNGLGIGMADFTTERLARAYGPMVTYVNLLTASEPGGNTREGPLPIALASDREAIEVSLFSSLAGSAPRLCRVRNTDALNELWVSEALLDEVNQNPRLRVVDPPAPLAFDEAGNLF